MECSHLLKNITLNTRGDLVTTTDLQALNISINTELHLLICCKSALTSANYQSHFSRKHPGMKLNAAATAAIANFELAAQYPCLGDSRIARPIISGLPTTTNQYGCPKCAYAGNKRGVVSHLKEDHPQSRLAMEQGLTTQVLNLGATKICIRVEAQVEVAPADPKDLLAKIKSFEVPADQQIPNARLISPWLMGTLWHKEVEPHREHLPALCALVAMPKDDEFPDLRRCVQEYFYQATALIEDTELLVLQKLNTSNLDHEWAFFFFSVEDC
ncbi:hypothetical protein B0H12DRAFT_1080393 [Mycena haematopus]|nr:hypothetical protein B0H12DRAFT_1080393 [Mycena haematopus]